MSMKTILVPMESHDGMKSVLETALLLARRCGSYIEGFPLRFGISEFVAVDPAGCIPLESYRQESLEEAAQARRLFESFMQEHNVPRASAPASALSFGWLDEAPEGESFVGSYGRVFDITVLEPARRQHHRPAQSRDRIRTVRKRPADPAVAAVAAAQHRDQHHGALELQHRAGARHRASPCRCCSRPSASRCSRGRRAGRAGAVGRAVAHAPAAQRHRREADVGRARRPQHRRGDPHRGASRRAATCW